MCFELPSFCVFLLCFLSKRFSHIAAEEVQKVAEQRISSRIIMYVPDIHGLSLQKPKGQAMGKPEEVQLKNEQKIYLDSTHQINEKFRKRMHENHFHRNHVKN